EIEAAGQWPLAVRRRSLVREVVEEHQIEIGRGGHFTAAELAHCNQRDAAAFHAPVRRLEFKSGRGEKRLCDQFRKLGISPSRLARDNSAGKHAHADQKQLLLAEDTAAVESIFVGVSLLERPPQSLL